MAHAVLTELVLVMAAAVAAAALLRRLNVPPVVGFIVAGMLIGPGGLGLIRDRHQIEMVAEVGVMLLLFTVGLKLRLGDLWKLRTSVFGGGTTQVLVTGGIAFAVTLIGSLATSTIVTTYPVIVTLAVGGMSPFILGVILGVGLTIGNVVLLLRPGRQRRCDSRC